MTGQKDLTQSYIRNLQQASQVSCPMEGCGQRIPCTDTRIREHFMTKHSDYIEAKDVTAIVRDVKRGRYVPVLEPQQL
jgi:hypothetical protein